MSLRAGLMVSVAASSAAYAQPTLVPDTETQLDSVCFISNHDFVNGSANQWYCGGVLIAPNKVLTAAHCTPYSNGRDGVDEVLYDPDRYYVGFRRHPDGSLADPDVSASFYQVDVIDAEYPPSVEFYRDASDSLGIQGVDLVVLTLETSVTHITPMAVHEDPESIAIDADAAHAVVGPHPVRGRIYAEDVTIGTNAWEQIGPAAYRHLVRTDGYGWPITGDSGGIVFVWRDVVVSPLAMSGPMGGPGSSGQAQEPVLVGTIVRPSATPGTVAQAYVALMHPAIGPVGYEHTYEDTLPFPLVLDDLDQNGNLVIEAGDFSAYIANIGGGPCPASEPCDRFDVNNDEMIDQTDLDAFVAALLEHLNEPLPCPLARNCALGTSFDVNGDGFVTPADISAFIGAMPYTECADCIDFNADGFVDEDDLDLLVCAIEPSLCE